MGSSVSPICCCSKRKRSRPRRWNGADEHPQERAAALGTGESDSGRHCGGSGHSQAALPVSVPGLHLGGGAPPNSTACDREGSDVAGRHRRRLAAGVRRSGAPPADLLRPPDQRGQVHPYRRDDHRRCATDCQFPISNFQSSGAGFKAAIANRKSKIANRRFPRNRRDRHRGGHPRRPTSRNSSKSSPSSRRHPPRPTRGPAWASLSPSGWSSCTGARSRRPPPGKARGARSRCDSH